MRTDAGFVVMRLLYLAVPPRLTLPLLLALPSLVALRPSHLANRTPHER